MKQVFKAISGGILISALPFILFGFNWRPTIGFGNGTYDLGSLILLPGVSIASLLPPTGYKFLIMGMSVPPIVVLLNIAIYTFIIYGIMLIIFRQRVKALLARIS